MKKAYPSLRLAAAGLIVLSGALTGQAFGNDSSQSNMQSDTSQSDTNTMSTGSPSDMDSSAGSAATTPESNARQSQSDMTSQTTAQSTSQGPATEVKVQELNRNPQKFAGQDVVVKGKISKIEGSGAFILEGSGLLNNKILVIMAKNQQAGVSGQQAGTKAPVIKEKSKVRLTGKVEQIDLTKIEETYQPGLKAEIKAEFEGTMPVLIVPPSGFKSAA